jgi:DNA polymerase III epsilon subunit-like protein
MNDRNQKLVFLDLECAGTNPARHPIIQIAAVAVDHTLQPFEAFEAKVTFDPRTSVRNSLRKNHYSRGKWAKEAREPEVVAADFAAFLRRHATVPALAGNGDSYQVAQLVAHNANFDGEFLRAWYERLGIFLPARFQVLCTLQRALWLIAERPTLARPPNYKLATLCHYFGVPFHAASAHDALGDVSATVCLYQALLAANEPGSSPTPGIPPMLLLAEARGP